MNEKDFNKYLIRISNKGKKEIEVETDLERLYNIPAFWISVLKLLPVESKYLVST